MGRIVETGWKCDYCGGETKKADPPHWSTLVLTLQEPACLEYVDEKDKTVLCPACVRLVRAFLRKLSRKR